MTDYDFTLKFNLPGLGAELDQCVAALAAAGCDDALVGVGQSGRIALSFTRSARSAFEAISTALCDVRKAIPQAVLVEASPDFVGLTDVAEIAGCTRQNMRKLMTSNISTFPIAVHEGKPALWHLANVLEWLREQQKRQIDSVLLEVAETNMTLNIAKEARKCEALLYHAFENDAALETRDHRPKEAMQGTNTQKLTAENKVMTKKELPKGLDGRTRDQHSPKSGQIREKRADTKVGTLRQEYGPDFAAGVRSDMKLGTLRERERKTLSQMVKDAKK